MFIYFYKGLVRFLLLSYLMVSHIPPYGNEFQISLENYILVAPHRMIS